MIFCNGKITLQFDVIFFLTNQNNENVKIKTWCVLHQFSTKTLKHEQLEFAVKLQTK